MAKEFCVTIDVVMSGDIYIEAETKEEAMKKANQMYFNARDLRDFHQVSTEVIECEENDAI